jgi:hypothetical protein
VWFVYGGYYVVGVGLGLPAHVMGLLGV